MVVVCKFIQAGAVAEPLTVAVPLVHSDTYPAAMAAPLVRNAPLICDHWPFASPVLRSVFLLREHICG